MEELAAAENRMSSIESRLLSIEKTSVSSNSEGVQEALSEYQNQILEKLKGIRSSIVEEGGDIAKIKEERDAAVTENAKLRKDIDKLNYRIQHLVKALNVEESKH